MQVFNNIFESITSPENLFLAWDEFKIGKRHKQDVAYFEYHLEENVFKLCRELRARRYQHGLYQGFWIHDPKRRHIHKALVWDRVVHHAVFRVLNPIFEPTFIVDSFSCRKDKGTHRGVQKVARMLRVTSRNNTRPTYALKCDIRKFFDSVDHAILLKLLQEKIKDENAVWLLENIVGSFSSQVERERE